MIADRRPMPRVGPVVAGLVPAVFLTLFFVWPVATLIWRGLADSPARLGEVIATGRFLRILWFTTWQATLSTVLTLVIAWPLTWLVANRTFAGRKLTRVAVTVPFVLPTVVVASAFIALMDRTGIELRHTVWAVLGAHVFFNVAVVVRGVGGLWSQLDRRPEEAARTLGASPWRAFVVVTLPRLRRAIVSASAIVFLFTFTSFAVILLLGGPRRATLETEIYRWAVTRTDIATAAALSILQMVVVIGLVSIGALAQRRAGAERLIIDRAEASRTARGRLAVGAILAWSASMLGLPLAVLIERSVRTGDGWSFDHYRALGERARLLPIAASDALVNSMSFALVAAGIAAVIGGLASLVVVHGHRIAGRLIDLGMLLPLATSAVTLGFGVLITFDSGIFDLRGSWWIIPLAQSLIAIPFVMRMVVPVLRSIDPKVREAAAALGASPGRVRREIDLRIGAKALATGVGFAFAISLGEFGATSFVGRRPEFMTVPLAIGRLLGTPGASLRGQAMALSVVLMVVTALVVLVGDWLHPGSRGAQ